MSTVPTAEHDRSAEDLERDGHCVVKGVFERELIDEWKIAFEKLCESRRAAGAIAYRGKNRFYLSLPWTLPFANEHVFRNRRVLGIIERALGPEYAMVQLAADTAMPGSEYQDLHRDHAPLFSESFATPLYALAVNFALGPVTLENGPLEVVRGTHRTPRAEAISRAESGIAIIEPITLEVGDVVIRTPLALHRGSPNRTHDPRTMVVMGYVRSWLHTPHLGVTVPRRVHEQWSDEARSLVRCKIADLPEQATESYVRFQY